MLSRSIFLQINICKSFLFEVTESQDHRIIQAGSDLEQSLFQSPAQNRVNCSGSSGFHPVRFWTPLRVGNVKSVPLLNCCHGEKSVFWHPVKPVFPTQVCYLLPSNQAPLYTAQYCLFAESPSHPLPDAEGGCKVLLNLSLSHSASHSGPSASACSPPIILVNLALVYQCLYFVRAPKTGPAFQMQFNRC